MQTLDIKKHTTGAKYFHAKYLAQFFKYHDENGSMLEILRADVTKSPSTYSNGKGGCVKLQFKPNKDWMPIKIYTGSCTSQYDMYSKDNQDFKPKVTIPKYEFNQLMVDESRVDEGYKVYKVKDDVTEKNAVPVVLVFEYIQKYLPKLVESTFESGKVIRTAEGKKMKGKKATDVLIAPFDSKIFDLVKTNHHDINCASFKFQLPNECKYPTALNVRLNGKMEKIEDFAFNELNTYVPKYSKIHLTGVINTLSFSAQGISVQCLANELWSTPSEMKVNEVKLDDEDESSNGEDDSDSSVELDEE